ncbi:MAG: pyridoxal-dependent decarboxylase [Candidatus Bathyarchaeia archaeon]
MRDEGNSRLEHKHRDISPNVFRYQAHQAVDWIVEYLENMNQYPVLARSKPGDLKAKIPESPPTKPEPFENIMDDFQKIILPGITHWNHPRFFAYFSVSSSYPGIIGEMLCSTLNVNAMLWKTSPSATELEEVATDWLRQMLGLPEQFEGVINDTASVSSLCAMAAAREHAGLQIREKGLTGRNLPQLRIYTSEEAHSSIEKAAIVLGIGQNGVRKVPTDEAFRMDTQVLENILKEDIEEGVKPICIIPTIGTTSTTSIDPVKEISELCMKYGIWLHVDAAYGGAAATIREMRPLFAGWENADSIVVNPHKWLFTPLDCSILYCRRPEVLKQAFSLTPEYLRTAEASDVKNLMDYGVSLGRRFRALKLWMILRALGSEGIANVIQEHISYAKRLEKMVRATPNFELLAPVPFSTLVVRFYPKTPVYNESEINNINEKLMEAINQTGQVFLSHTKLRGKYGIRLTIGNIKTTWEDVSLAWVIIQQKAKELSANN